MNVKKEKDELEKELNAIGIYPHKKTETCKTEKKFERVDDMMSYYKWCAFLENICKENLGHQDGCKKECRDELIELIKKQTEKKEYLCDDCSELYDFPCKHAIVPNKQEKLGLNGKECGYFKPLEASEGKKERLDKKMEECINDPELPERVRIYKEKYGNIPEENKRKRFGKDKEDEKPPDPPLYKCMECGTITNSLSFAQDICGRNVCPKCGNDAFTIPEINGEKKK